MKITDELLTINSFSRPGKRIVQVRAVVLHWTANPGASAMANRNFFENRKKGTTGYGSAHYIIGIEGEIIRCIPENEIAYHVGTTIKDPASGKTYTDFARQIFGQYALSAATSPNWVSIGIEMCPVDISGTFTAATLNSAIELSSDLLQRYKMSTDALCTHHDVVGWKDCPRLWVQHPELFIDFKNAVSKKI